MICTITDLRVATDGPLNKQMVLEAGAGGTTICEVHLKTGPEYGLIVEPRTAEAIKYDVGDFAEYLLRVSNVDHSSRDGEEEGSPGISKEVNRAIRNMSRLTETKTKNAAGRVIRTDPACTLAAQYHDAKELVVQVLSRMGLPRRDRRAIWYPEDSRLPPLLWLQKTFMEINNGRQPQFSVPDRIDVVVPMPVLENGQLDVRIIDTKGIDGAATRADLAGC